MKGQVAIIVLLVSAVMLTLGLGMSKKESVNVKINTNDELLKKAFDTAESGINYYLGTGGTSYSSPDNVSFADVSTSKISDGSDKIDFGEYLQQGNSENYWLVNHLFNGDIGTTYFNGPDVSVCTVSYSGQVKVDYFYKVGVNYNIKRNLINLNSNCFTVGIVGSPVLLAVTPISSGGKFYIQALNGGTFSSQGIDVIAVGRAGGTQEGVNTQAKQKLSIRQRYMIPGFLLSGMMAEGSILSD
ncbi:MAG: hypothetical protein WC069_01290 [Candidatus Shapirobacteria bacterium]